MRKARLTICPRCKGQTLVGTDYNFAAFTVTLDPRQVDGGRYSLTFGPTIWWRAEPLGRGWEEHDCANPCPILDMSQKKVISDEPMF